MRITRAGAGGRFGWSLLGGYVALSALRHVMTHRAWRVPEPGPEPNAVVLQAILSGDPHLGDQLAQNLANHPTTRFRWLLDADDAQGRRIADRLADGEDRVEVRLYEPAPAHANPKVFKLARAVDDGDDLIAVLDDDTVLPAATLARAATALRDADLVTGVPHYQVDGGGWSRMLAAFVNAGSLLTYLPPSLAGPPVSINGMFYLTRRDALDRAGGFTAIEDRVCDDYELALRYRRAGLRIVQAALPVRLRTTVPDAAAYRRIMRRWMVFSLRLLRDERSAMLLTLVVLPSVAPTAVLTIAVLARRRALAGALLAALAGKTVATGRLRRDLLGTRTTGLDLVLEGASDLLLPLHTLGAVAARGRIVWRGSAMVVRRDGRVGRDGGVARDGGLGR